MTSLRGKLTKARSLGVRGTTSAVRARVLFRWGFALEPLGIHVLPVHYYSPVPSVRELRASPEQWARRMVLLGIDLSLPGQSAFLSSLAPHRDELAAMPTYAEVESGNPGEGMGAVDAELLYLVIRMLGSRRVVEVGSGTSTAYIAAALHRNAVDGRPGRLTAIEPYRYRLLRQVVGAVPCEIIPKPVQQVPLDLFEDLEDGDVLFIDSSHCARIGSDVMYLVLDVLPRLRPGVHVHVHDIPFPYGVLDADDVVVHHMFWNEWALIAAFLQFNSDFEILLSARLLHHDDPGALAAALPSYSTDQPIGPSSLWLRRTLRPPHLSAR